MNKYTLSQFHSAIEQFLDYGNQSLEIGHHGYFSKGGWAWECLNWYLNKIEEIGTILKITIVLVGKLSQSELEDFVGKSNADKLTIWYFKNRIDFK